MFFALFPSQGHAFHDAAAEYIRVLDITVVETNQGEIMISKIGRFGPFKRYSWFRVGDVIEAVDGVKLKIFQLRTIARDRLLKIRFRRGALVAERQISLERNFYDYPRYINFRNPK